MLTTLIGGVNHVSLGDGCDGVLNGWDFWGDDSNRLTTPMALRASDTMPSSNTPEFPVMSEKRPLVRRMAPLVTLPIFRMWMGSLRARWHGHEHHQAARDLCGSVIYASWHEHLLFLSYSMRDRGIQVMISRHRDGEILAQIMQRLGFRTARGSTTRGGAMALCGMLRNRSKSIDYGVTPDGPRGPRREVQPGVLLLASLSGYPIVPLVVAYRKCWRNRSWDQTVLPRPATRVVALAAAPVVVGRGIKPDSPAFQQATAALQKALNEGDTQAESDFETLYRTGKKAL